MSPTYGVFEVGKMKYRAALIIAGIAVAPMIAFAVLWTGVLAALVVMYLWYSGSLLPVSFLVAGLGYYLLHRHNGRPHHAKLKPAFSHV